MNYRLLPSDLKEKAKKELNETPCRIEADLEHLESWLAKQPHLNARIDSLWLLNFLRGCKFSQQRTKEKLDLFYSIRPQYPKFYTKRDPLLPEIQEILAQGIILPLTATDAEILVIRWPRVDPRKVSLTNLIKVILMILDMYINENPAFVVTGLQIIIDLRGFPLSYLKQTSSTVFKRLLCSVSKGYPIRLNECSFIKSSASSKYIINLCKPFLKRKLQARIKIYEEEKVNELYDRIPLSILPKEYGGEGDYIDEIAVKWKRKVESYRDWFLDDEKYQADELKRPEELKNSFDIFGAEGSFRQLNFE